MFCIEKIDFDNGNVLKICIDEYAESPRDFCEPLGHMICWHPRYNLGDSHDFNSPEDFMEHMYREYSDYIILSLYLYDHGGITMNTTGFHCQWDSGQVGYIYITADEVIKEYGCYYTEEDVMDLIAKRIPDHIRERVENYLRAEVELYDTWLRGEVYGFVLEDKDGEHIDSCWGFYGNPKESGMIEHLPDECHETFMAA